MHLSADGKIGIVLGLLGLAGTGAVVVWPEHTEIGWAMMSLAAIGGVALAVHHFGERWKVWKKRAAFFGGIFGVIIVGLAGWHFWPWTIAKETRIASRGPQSVLDLFKSDFPGLMQGTNTNGFKIFDKTGNLDVGVNVAFSKYLDFQSGTKFYSAYFPAEQPRVTYDAIAFLANVYPQIVANLDTLQVTARDPADSSPMQASDLKFSGVIYVYYESDLSLEQLGYLQTLYNSKGLIFKPRSREYATTRWLQARSVPK
jgi:hypothetical protein